MVCEKCKEKTSDSAIEAVYHSSITGLRNLKSALASIIRPSAGALCQTCQDVNFKTCDTTLGSLGYDLSNSLRRSVHCSAVLLRPSGMHNEPKEWPKYNDVVYPPSLPGEPRRPAEVVHYRSNIKYSLKKLWYIASMIRGMTVDEALKQLSFIERKGSAVVKEVIREAQDIAVRDHGVEFKSNMWIEDSFVRKAKTVKGMRRHARGRIGTIHFRYTHYFLRLREGRPPKHYYPPRPTGNEMVEEYLQRLRERRIIQAL